MSANSPFYGLTPVEYERRKEEAYDAWQDTWKKRYKKHKKAGHSKAESRKKADKDVAALRKFYHKGDYRSKGEIAADKAAVDAKKAAWAAAHEASEQKKQQQQMMQQQQEMMQQAKNMMEAMMAPQEEEAIQVDGISSGFAEPEPSEKEFQDQTAVEADIDTIDDLHDLSMSALRPEIIAKFVGCYGHDSYAGEGIGSYKFKDLLEANILRDQLADDVYRRVYSHMTENEPDILDSAAERVDEIFEKTQQEIDSLISYRSMINEALSSLDLQECGAEIGEIISEIASAQLQVEDMSIEKLPVDLEDLVSQTLNSSRSVDEYFSNSKLYFGILAGIYEAMTGYSSHMTNHVYPGRPFNLSLRERTKYSLKQFQNRQKSQTSRATKSVLKKGFAAIVPSFASNKATSELQQLLCCLSNEMIISGGIRRLLGTELGNKYGVTTDDPFTGVFGINMGILHGGNSIEIPSVDPKKGSLTDFITIEDVDSNRTVLPFELNDVTLGRKNYLAGSKYVVEGPARKIDEGFADPLGQYVKNFDGEVKSASSYFNELMGLDESTLLAPQGLLIRILEDIRTICLEASKPVDQIDRNTIKSAVRLTMCNATQTADPTGSKHHILRHTMNSADILMLLDIVNGEEEQPEYRAAIHHEIIDGIDKTIGRVFRSRNDFSHTVTERWIYKSNFHYTPGAQGVIPVGRFSDAKFQIDADGEVESIYKMILTATDEIMSESHAFAGRKGSTASYKNDQGYTAYSGMDYSAVLSIVYYVYHWLLKDLLHWNPVRAKSSGSYSRTIQPIRDKNKKVADALTAILSTYKEGGEFEDLFDDDQNSLAVEGLTSTTRIGKTLTMGKIIDIVEGLRRHRSFLKCNIAALSAISKNVIQKSLPLATFQTEVRDVLTDKIKLANVKNKKLAAFCGLVKQPIGKEALRGLTSMQVNNTVAAMMRMSPAAELEKRQNRFVMTSGLVEALRIFNDSKDIKRTEGIVCVGLPNGMIDNLRMSVVNSRIRKNESSDLGKLVVRLSRDNELYSSLEFRDVEVPFDASIYLMPNSYNGILSDEDEEDIESKRKNPDPVRDMINKVIFYRLESGNIIEQISGQEMIENGNEQTYSILKNHVYSDLARISIDAAMGIDINEADLKKYEDVNSSHISSHGLQTIQAISKAKNLKLFSTEPTTVKNVLTEVEIDELTKFYEMKTGYAGQVALERLSDYDICDIKRAGQSCLYTAELDRHRIIGTSMFDRIFYVPVNSRDFRIDYSEGIIQERRRFSYGRLSSRRFDISGYVCDVRVS